MTHDDRPIGVFDSGIGGLTVAKAIFQLLPNEEVRYFGDTARVPYGPKSPATVLHYSREAAAFLLAQEIKMLVVACNTATAHAAEALAHELSVPVVGVVEPGARTAARTTRSGRVGVIGTTGTIASGAYDLAVRRLVEDARVYAQPCPLFVPLIEEGWQEHEATRLVAEDYLRPLIEVDIDVLILGCTHYPLLASVIQQTLGPKVQLVDSAHETAIEVKRELERRGALRTSSAPPSHQFFASDSPMRFREVGVRFLDGVSMNVQKAVVEGLKLR